MGCLPRLFVPAIDTSRQESPIQRYSRYHHLAQRHHQVKTTTNVARDRADAIHFCAGGIRLDYLPRRHHYRCRCFHHRDMQQILNQHPMAHQPTVLYSVGVRYGVYVPCRVDRTTLYRFFPVRKNPLSIHPLDSLFATHCRYRTLWRF